MVIAFEFAASVARWTRMETADWLISMFIFLFFLVLLRKGFSDRCTLRHSYFVRPWAAKFTLPLHLSSGGWDVHSRTLRKTRNKPIITNELTVLVTNSWSIIITCMITHASIQEKKTVYSLHCDCSVREAWRHVKMTWYLYLNLLIFINFLFFSKVNINFFQRTRVERGKHRRN